MPGFGENFGELFGGSESSSVQALITKCLRAVDISVDDEDYREKCLTFLNFAYLFRLKGRHWKFLNRELYIDLEAPYEAGTVLMTQNDATVTEDTNPPVIDFDATDVGKGFAIGSELYRILSMTSQTSIELSTDFAGETAAEQSYKILYDRFVLTETVHALRSLVIQGHGEINPMGLQEFRQKKAENPTLVGVPRYYTLVAAEEDSGQWTMELYPAPDRRYACQVEYTAKLIGVRDEEDNYLLLPSQHHDVIYYSVLSDLYAGQENTAMSDRYGKLAALAWQTLASDQEMTDSVARIQPARKYHGRGQRYRGYFGLNWFGKVED